MAAARRWFCLLVPSFSAHAPTTPWSRRWREPSAGSACWKAPRKPASRTRLRDVIGPGITPIDYTYDFGDNWEHELVISDVRRGDPGKAYPRYIGGERDCPPEDCGGIPGFYEMLEARADPTHPDHAEISEWLDEYDPDELDVFPIEVALGRIAARRNAAAKRILKPAND